MTNYLIYGGLGILLVGAVAGVIGAVIGCKIQGWKFSEIFLPRRFFNPPMPVTPAMKTCVWIWGIAWVMGTALLIWGIKLGLNAH